MIHLQWMQAYFEQRGGNCLAFGVVSTVALTIHSKWGRPAALCFTITSGAGYFYLRKQVHVLEENFSWVVVAVPFVTYFSPTAGFLLTGVVGLFLASKAKKLGADNQRLQKHVQSLEESAKSSEEIKVRFQEIEKRIAALVPIHEGVQREIKEADGTFGDLEQQLSRLEQSCRVKFPELEIPENVGQQVQDLTRMCQAQQNQIQASLDNISRGDQVWNETLSRILQNEQARGARINDFLNNKKAPTK